MMKIASGNTLLCRFRMDDDLVWGLLTNHGKGAANDTTSRLARQHPDGRPSSGSRLNLAPPERLSALPPQGGACLGDRQSRIHGGCLKSDSKRFVT